MVDPVRFISNALRAKEMASALIRNGFLEVLEQIDAPQSWLSSIVPKRAERLTIWERVRVTFEDLGPTFVKIGQLLSTRSDVLPPELIDALKKLRNDVRPEKPDAIERVLQQELGKDIKELFDVWEETPIAAGSLAQVHKAKLIGQDEWMAVKVQRPGIRRSIKADLEILGWFAKQLHERIPTLQVYDLPSMIDEAAEGLRRELDFAIEARNATYFNRTNPYPDEVFAPTVQQKYTTEKILITEFIEGSPPDKLEGLKAKDRRTIAERGARSVFHQIIIAGFFHADPHGGNVLVTKDLRIAFVDWGLAGHLTRKMRYLLADLLEAITKEDSERFVQVVLAHKMGSTRVDETRLEKDIRFVIRRADTTQLSGTKLGEIVMEVLHVLGTNGISLIKDYVLLAKAVMAIEQVGEELDPSFPVPSAAVPFIRDLRMERMHPEQIFRQAYWMLTRAFISLKELPNSVHRVLQGLEDGKLRITMDHEGLVDGLKTLNTASNRIVLGLIIGALIIGSSMIITTGTEPLTWGYPSLGLWGFMISGVLGLWLVWDILRHGRHK